MAREERWGLSLLALLMVLVLCPVASFDASGNHNGTLGSAIAVGARTLPAAIPVQQSLVTLPPMAGDPHPHSAIIIEPRPHRLLLPVIDHMLQHIPNATLVQVFHSSANRQPLQQHYAPLIRQGRVHLTDLSEILGSDMGNGSVAMLNGLYFNISFWKRCRGENLLLFQLDSCVCSRSPWTWRDFIGQGWGWIGAPHVVATGGVSGRRNYQRMIHHNGGFSFRSKFLTLRILEKHPNFYARRFASGRAYNEDTFYSAMHAFEMRRAPLEVARRFAVGDYFYPTPFAIHKPWGSGLTPSQLRILQRACPELHTLFGVVPAIDGVEAPPAPLPAGDSPDGRPTQAVALGPAPRLVARG